MLITGSSPHLCLIVHIDLLQECAGQGEDTEECLISEGGGNLPVLGK